MTTLSTSVFTTTKEPVSELVMLSVLVFCGCAISSALGMSPSVDILGRLGSVSAQEAVLSGARDSTMGLGGISACSLSVNRVHSPNSIRPSRRLAAISAYRGMSIFSVSIWLSERLRFRNGVVAACTPGMAARESASNQPTAGKGTVSLERVNPVL